MSYCSRNYGCRVQDKLRIHGYRAVVLENEKLEVTVLPDKGADIISLTYKPKDIDFMWRSPYGLDDNEKPYRGDRNFLEMYEGGWQEILPTGSGGGVYKNARFMFHGETPYLPWTWEIIEDTPACVAVRFSVTCKKMPIRAERIMRLRSHQSELEIEETVENLSPEGFHFMWGHHPAIGAPFLSEHCTLQLPTEHGVLIERIWKDDSVQNGEIHWPYLPNGIDLSRIRPEGDESKFMIMMDQLSRGSYQIVNSQLKLGVEMNWDLSVMPYLWLWMNFNGEAGYPWYKRAYLMAVEPWTSIIYDGTDGLNEAIANGSAVYLSPGDTKDFCMKFRVFEETED